MSILSSVGQRFLTSKSMEPTTAKHRQPKLFSR